MSEGAHRSPQETPTQELEVWLRANLEGSTGKLLGQGYQATVHHFRSPVGDIVVKGPHTGSLRGWLGRLAIKREYWIYERLRDVEGVPRVRGLIDDRYLVLEHIEGDSLRAKQLEVEDRDRFFARLLGTIEAMHARGIAHGDLKRKDNILVGADETPYIIDFGVACSADGTGGFLRRRYFETIRQMDLNAWTKLKYGRNVAGLSHDDAARYRPLWLELIARWIRIPWQTLTLRRPRQRWRRKP